MKTISFNLWGLGDIQGLWWLMRLICDNLYCSEPDTLARDYWFIILSGGVITLNPYEIRIIHQNNEPILMISNKNNHDAPLEYLNEIIKESLSRYEDSLTP